MANPSIQLGTNSNWAIKEDKLLAYKEYNDYFFNKEFDFSRGTSATYVAKDGLIKTAGIQPNIVTNGDFSELGSELVTNGDFATDSDWSKDSGWTIANGKASQDGTGTGNDGDIIQNSILDTSKIYKIVLDVVDYTQGTLYIDTSNIDLNVNGVGTYTLYFTPSSTNLFIRTRFSGFIGSIDNVSVKQVDPNDYWTLGTGWSIEDGKAVNDGSQTGNSLLQQTSILTLNKLYKVSYDLTVDSGQIYVRLGFSGQGAIRSTSGSFVEHITCGGNTNFDLFATSTYSGTVDNISVQEIQTDTPRIDFTNDTKGHLLLEPSRTNIITNSSNFSAASWANVSATRTSVNIPLPDGTTGGFQITQNGGASDRIQDALGLSSNNHFFSLFVKGTSYASDFIFRIRSLRGEDAKFNMNTNNEISYNSGTSANYFIEEYENGWYRVGFESTMSNTQSNYFQIYPDRTTDSFGSIYIWGAQVEEGSYATSYIPTTSATSTRNADICNNSGSAQDFNSEEGVLYAEIAALESTSSGSKFISISDGTYNNRASILFSNGATNKIRCFLRVGGTSQVDKIENVTDVTDFNKVAFSYKENEFKVFINGSQAGSTDTSGSVWSSGTITKLSLTEINSALGAFNGKVRNVQVFTEALTDAELQELTS